MMRPKFTRPKMRHRCWLLGTSMRWKFVRSSCLHGAELSDPAGQELLSVAPRRRSSGRSCRGAQSQGMVAHTG